MSIFLPAALYLKTQEVGLLNSVLAFRLYSLCFLAPRECVQVILCTDSTCNQPLQSRCAERACGSGPATGFPGHASGTGS